MTRPGQTATSHVVNDDTFDVFVSGGLAQIRCGAVTLVLDPPAVERLLFAVGGARSLLHDPPPDTSVRGTR